MNHPVKTADNVESKVSLQLVDPLGKFIADLKFQIRDAQQKIVAKGATNGEGRIPTFVATLGTLLTLHVERFGTDEMKLVKTLIPWSEDFRFKIVSGKRKEKVVPKKHEGPPGPYKRKTYKVKRGDTLSEIALAHRTTAAALAALNGIKVTDIIRVDQVLKVPNDPVAAPAAPSAVPAAPAAPKEGTKGKQEAPADDVDTDAERPAAKNAPPTAPVPTSQDEQRGENGTPKTSVKPVCDQSGCIKLGDKGLLVEELNIRLMGFGNTIQAPAPLDEFTGATERAVKQFQRDYMGVAETGKVCGAVLAALDDFRGKYPLSFNGIACQCRSHNPGNEGCHGFGMARTGSASVHHLRSGQNVLGKERPGIHRALLWSLRAALFYLHDKESAMGYRFSYISSGYRCWKRAKQMGIFTTNHMGNALDVHFKRASNGSHVDGNSLESLKNKIFVEKLRARPTWDMDNRLSLEPQSMTDRWVHMDVRQFKSAYQLDRFYAKDIEAVNGESLMVMAKREQRFGLVNCGGIAPVTLPSPGKPAPPKQPPKPPPKPPQPTSPAPYSPSAVSPFTKGNGPFAGPPSSGRKPAATLSVSQMGLDFIRAWESGDIIKQHLKPYNDNKGYCTIGVGHLIDGLRSCAALKSSGSEAYKRFERGFTAEQESALFIEDVQRVVNTALKSIHVPVHQYEFDALIALAYNTPGLFKFNKLLANLNSGNYSGCCDEFADITNGGDKGLVKRRQSEMKLFRNNIYDARH